MLHNKLTCLLVKQRFPKGCTIFKLTFIKILYHPILSRYIVEFFGCFSYCLYWVWISIGHERKHNFSCKVHLNFKHVFVTLVTTPSFQKITENWDFTIPVYCYLYTCKPVVMLWVVAEWRTMMFPLYGTWILAHNAGSRFHSKSLPFHKTHYFIPSKRINTNRNYSVAHH